MKRTDLPEADSHMPVGSERDDPPAPQPTEGGWLTASEEAERPASSGAGLLEPLRRGISRLSASWRYISDPAERHALLQFARGTLSRMAQSFRHPDMAASMTASAPQSILPSALSEPDPSPPFVPETALARLRSALRQLPEKGEVVVPGNLQALDRLLGDTLPAMDFEAADLLHDCFPRGTRHSGNRVLLAVARNLTRNFGRPGRLPMTSGKAWTMLDPAVFVDQMAAQLAEISDFVLNWQAQEKSFLILEFAEVELIEYLFEHLHPRRHGALLIKVMDFKVLSTRRAGLLRRIPARVRRFVQHTAGAPPSVPLAYARDSAALLELIEKRVFFRPVVEAAAAARAELEKVISRLTPAGVTETEHQNAVGASGKAGLGQIMQAVGPSAGPSAAARPEMGTPDRISAAPMPPPPIQTVSVSAPPLAAGLPVPVPPLRKRFGNRQKTEAVMRVLAGENREQVAAAMGARPQLVESWLDSFLNGGAAALTPRKAAAKKRKSATKATAPVDTASIDDLKAKLQALLQTVEVLSDQIQSLPAESTARAAPPALPPPLPVVQSPPTVTASPPPGFPPPGFPAEDPNPPPRLKRSRMPRRQRPDDK
jgi:hypothetical protein